MEADWNDWRYFLAVARSGSTLAAGRALRVSQTTVARRVAALELALDLTLFERRQAGYVLTPVGEGLVHHAEAIEQAAIAASEAGGAQSREARGTVRFTTEEIFGVTLISPLLRELHDLYPDIRIELDASPRVLDLGAGEADIALRSTSKPQPAGIVGRALCRDDWTLYCSAEYATRNGVPKSIEALRRHALIGGGGGNLWRAYSAWLHELGLEDQVAMQQGSSVGLLAAVRSGAGIAVLPCVIADAEDDLIRCMPPKTDHGRTMWLLTHERVRHTASVRAVIDFLYEQLSAHIRRLDREAA